MTAKKAAELVVCDRCNGVGGWSGWPGFTCFKCHGTGTMADSRARRPKAPPPLMYTWPRRVARSRTHLACLGQGCAECQQGTLNYWENR